MTVAGWFGWGIAALASVCAAVGWWHHRRDAAHLARCVHELRGPLGALALGLDLALRRGSLDGERIGALDLQLERAASALRELSRGSRPARRSLVSVGRLLTDTVVSLEPLAAGRGAELHLASVPEAIVPCDRGRLAQGLGNLIANAVEHGGRRISVSGRVGEGVVRLEVHDDGPGLAALAPVDARSGRLRPPRTGLHGHGLAVVAEVAADHGGRLLSLPAESGARVVLELPLHAPAGTPAALPG